MTDVDNMIIINKKKYEMYKLSLENAVAILNVDEKRKNRHDKERNRPMLRG